MPNIFLTIDKINALLKKQTLTAEDRDILQQLITGNTHHLGLIALSQQANSSQFKIIEQEFFAYYTSIGSSPWLYKRSINSIYKDLIILREHSENVIKALGMAKTKEGFNPYAALHDEIYLLTVKKYSGTLMLPIQQCMDYRLGNSKGECSGYVVEWIQDLLNNKKPFGIPIHSSPPFQPIVLQSPLGRLYPDLNHCAPLTKHIAELQQLNYRFATQGMDHKAKDPIYQYHQGGVILTHDVTELAKHLLKVSNLTPGFGYYLSVRNYNNGHALGFYKDSMGALHFLDVNTGWYRFQNDLSFIAWLGFYFPTMGYDKKYDGCELFAFGFQKKKECSSALSWNALRFFAKREAYLLGKRIAEPFHFFHHQAPIKSHEALENTSFERDAFAKDDLYKAPSLLTKREVSLPNFQSQEFKKAKQGSLAIYHSAPANHSQFNL